jgi:hypothetical protein
MIVTGAPADPLTMLGVTVSSIGAWARDALGASNSSRSGVRNRHLSRAVIDRLIAPFADR